jgi:hypothetical protein
VQLESKYRDGLRRTASPTYVDLEGDIVWTQEYLRYRVNRCTHSDAVQRVLFQIDGGTALPTCGDAPVGQILFPPRNEPLDFRLQLESKYRDGLKRAATSSHVDIEGDIVWTQEYIRYRVNWCDHYEATQRVFMQIDGRGVQPVCPPPVTTSTTTSTTTTVRPPECRYCPSPREQTVSSAGGTFSVAVNPIDSNADWTAVSEQPSWIRILSGSSGHGSGVVRYSVQPNGYGVQRSGVISVGGLSGLFPREDHVVTQRP